MSDSGHAGSFFAKYFPRAYMAGSSTDLPVGYYVEPPSHISELVELPADVFDEWARKNRKKFGDVSRVLTYEDVSF